MDAQRKVTIIGLASLLAVLALSLLVAPEAENFRAPLTQRIFYWHVPSAWVAYLAFAVTAFASARHLASRDPAQDRLAAASAEVGLVFSLIALGTGLTWAQAEFTGYEPLQDAKVVTLLVLILAYFAYLALRAAVDDPTKRGRTAAVFGLLSFLAVPLSYFASRVSLHPDFTRPEQSLAPELGMILGVSVLLFTLAYVAFAWHRVKLAASEDEIARLKAQEAA